MANTVTVIKRFYNLSLYPNNFTMRKAIWDTRKMSLWPDGSKLYHCNHCKQLFLNCDLINFGTVSVGYSDTFAILKRLISRCTWKSATFLFCWRNSLALQLASTASRRSLALSPAPCSFAPNPMILRRPAFTFYMCAVAWWGEERSMSWESWVMDMINRAKPIYHSVIKLWV